ncbi:MAG: carboxymuconolactone decarboxylase family protein [Ilumatobacteraceae bacterium]
MARIPYPDPDSLQPETREFLAKFGAEPINIFRMMAGGEGLLRAFSRFGNHLLAKSKLDPVLREIAILRVGVLSDATYEMYQHDRISRGLGMSVELLAGIRVGENDPVFDELQAAVVRYTDDVVQHVRASDATFDPLHEALSLQELQELTVTIGFYMLVSRYLETFGVDIEQPGGAEMDMSRRR